MVKSESKPALQLTRKGLFVWGGLIFFVMGWMFILGILVGRGNAPIPLKALELEQELQAQKETVLKQQQDEIEARVKQGDAPAAELEFYEALKKPPAESQRRIASSPKPAQKPTSSAKPPVAKPAPAKPAEQAVAPKPAPSPPRPVAAEPAPTSQPAPAAGGRFAIQVGAFREVESADALVNRLRQKGHAAYHLRTEVPGKGVWYRVRVGAFDSRSAADAKLALLNGEKIKGMVIGTP